MFRYLRQGIPDAKAEQLPVRNAHLLHAIRQILTDAVVGQTDLPAAEAIGAAPHLMGGLGAYIGHRLIAMPPVEG
jgi:hypothetical protein